MLDFIQIVDINYCDDLLPLIKVIKTVFNIIQFVIPIALILFGTIDLGKAVISSDDKEVKAAQSRLIKRCIYAVAIFFIVLLVNLIMNIIGDSQKGSKKVGNKSDTTSWFTCWKEKA